MRKVILITILTVGAVAAISAAPAQAQYSQCIKGRGCVPTSQASYNACFNLALTAQPQLVHLSMPRRQDPVR